MTLAQAVEKAREESRNGYVQHVNIIITEQSGDPDGPVIVTDYIVSDWYDGTTVRSFENGKEL